MAQMEGSTLADMFDFLSKELIRLQVRNCIKNFVLYKVTRNQSTLSREED